MHMARLKPFRRRSHHDHDHHHLSVRHQVSDKPTQIRSQLIDTVELKMLAEAQKPWDIPGPNGLTPSTTGNNSDRDTPTPPTSDPPEERDSQTGEMVEGSDADEAPHRAAGRSEAAGAESHNGDAADTAPAPTPPPEVSRAGVMTLCKQLEDAYLHHGSSSDVSLAIAKELRLFRGQMQGGA
ncbi:hypothetical protein BV22DRAFT_164629 [Leucogyrophana mollusca]|uniref:Uncharacterized protein n=1 Tax=Leucogyrophana mollusca TaxID=85980 RepID=A0ACB8BSI8_9AGAM|nr:hypothetical protein BV22DRAFT_164629 [Leucogyrophana mollusca]